MKFDWIFHVNEFIDNILLFSPNIFVKVLSIFCIAILLLCGNHTSYVIENIPVSHIPAAIAYTPHPYRKPLDGKGLWNRQSARNLNKFQTSEWNDLDQTIQQVQISSDVQYEVFIKWHEIRTFERLVSVQMYALNSIFSLVYCSLWLFGEKNTQNYMDLIFQTVFELVHRLYYIISHQ